jgi:D-arabinose 1-dehydrogenase-like Zn-dependent alcohol dehydrogenase
MEVPLKPDVVVDPTEESAQEKLKQWAGGVGLAGVIICTDKHEATTWALKAVRTRGIVVEIGLPVDPFPVDAFNLIFRELTYKGSLVSSKEQAQDMMQTVAKHGIATHVTPISLKEGLDVPGLYMNKHLKGRLVVDLEL